MVAAEQDAEVAPRRAAGLVDEVDLAGHALGFVHAVAALPDPDAFAVGLCAPQRLGVLVRIVGDQRICRAQHAVRSEELTSDLQSLMRISYAVFCLKKKNYQSQRSSIIIHTQHNHSTSRHID